VIDTDCFVSIASPMQQDTCVNPHDKRRVVKRLPSSEPDLGLDITLNIQRITNKGGI
jgi:hypothetical protein